MSSFTTPDQLPGPLFDGLDHLAIAVPDTEAALRIWRDKLGLRVLYAEKVNGGSILLTHLDLGNTHLQLVEPLDAGSDLDLAVREKGAHLHHFCFHVSDVEESRQLLAAADIATARVMHQGTRGKRALFIDREATDGITVELTGK